MSDDKTISSLSKEKRVFNPPESLKKRGWIKSLDEYKQIYQKSIDDPDSFWAEIASQFHWYKKWSKVSELDYIKPDIKWFVDGKTNVSYNCLDRHLEKYKNKVAIIWEGDNPEESKKITYAELYKQVNQFASVLKQNGVKKGDIVTIYMGMIPELAFAMLACSRIGAIHSIVFGGFSAEALRDRIADCDSSTVVTADAAYRAGKIIPLKSAVDKAIEEAKSVKKVIVVNRANQDLKMVQGRDIWYHEALQKADDFVEPEIMDAEDPLFILYTSGSTGKPKGVLHTTGGYMVYVATTHKYIFDYHDEDVYWCTADIGWVTGHSYIVYGPLANRATSLMFEGVPTYPQADRFWKIVEKYKVNSFYTAPTAIRALAQAGTKWTETADLSSLKVLGSVGEPINPEAWIWYHEHIGKSKTPIVDTWWQTETGGILITPLPAATPLKPGSATLPFFGVKPKIIRQDGSEADINEGGYLVIERSWPGQMRTVYGHHERFRETYFSQYKGLYFTGDGARKDEDGYYWLMGRVDDVINVSGHRIGTAEVESALVAHDDVAEAAVVGYPHDIKGQGIYAYVTLNAGKEWSDDLEKELRNHVAKEIGPIAKPDILQYAPSLPKTRSGKIMRRILRKIAENEISSLGDTSTLADPSVVDSLIAGSPHRKNK